LNTLSRATKKLIVLVSFLFFFCNFTDISCNRPPRDSKDAIPILSYLYIIDQDRKNSFEPNNTKEKAYCLDDTFKDPPYTNSISSIIYPQEDIDYYKVSFRNQRISLSHFTRQSEFYHILLESESGTLYDSRNPEAVNAFIESNQLVQIPIEGETYEARTILIKDLDFIYLKLLHNENYLLGNTGNSYVFLLKNDVPSITDISYFNFLRITGEFEPCP